METFDSLTQALDKKFGTALSDLPETLQERVAQDFFPLVWDELTADQRRAVALQWDYQNDPALNDTRILDWEAAFVGWEYWQKVPSLTAQEFCILRHVHDPRNYENDRTTVPGGIGKMLGDRVNDDLRMIERALGVGSTKPVADWVLWAEQQGWKIPSYLSASGDSPIEASTQENAPGDACQVYRDMADLHFDELSLAFVGDRSEEGVGANGMLEITARRITRRVPLALLKLVDLRRGQLNSQAVILLAMAYKGVLPRNEPNTKKISRLRGLLQEAFGIDSDPFDPYHPSEGWVPRFKIEDKLGAAYERAKREALRNTVSFEQRQARGHQHSADDALDHIDESDSRIHFGPANFEEEDDSTGDWLRSRDRNARR